MMLLDPIMTFSDGTFYAIVWFYAHLIRAALANWQYDGVFEYAMAG